MIIKFHEVYCIILTAAFCNVLSQLYTKDYDKFVFPVIRKEHGKEVVAQIGIRNAGKLVNNIGEARSECANTHIGTLIALIDLNSNRVVAQEFAKRKEIYQNKLIYIAGRLDKAHPFTIIWNSFKEETKRFKVKPQWDMENDPNKECVFIRWKGSSLLNLETNDCNSTAQYMCQLIKGVDVATLTTKTPFYSAPPTTASTTTITTMPGVLMTSTVVVTTTTTTTTTEEPFTSKPAFFVIVGVGGGIAVLLLLILIRMMTVKSASAKRIVAVPSAIGGIGRSATQMMSHPLTQPAQYLDYMPGVAGASMLPPQQSTSGYYYYESAY